MEDDYLDVLFHMRSNDLFLGHPFNIASYALLLCLVADQTQLRPRRVLFDGGDVHLYVNHLDQVGEQLGRAPKDCQPELVISGPRPESISGYRYEQLELRDYLSHPPIKAPIAV